MPSTHVSSADRENPNGNGHTAAKRDTSLFSARSIWLLEALAEFSSFHQKGLRAGLSNEGDLSTLNSCNFRPDVGEAGKIGVKNWQLGVDIVMVATTGVRYPPLLKHICTVLCTLWHRRIN